jgi:kynureninase
MDLTRQAAGALDAEDPLAGFRARFTGDDLLYLDGNSLGRLPVETPAAVARAVEQEWGRGLVGSWSSWIEVATRIGDALAAGVLGARPGEALVADST